MFLYERVAEHQLQDQAGRRIALLGSIDGSCAVLVVERAAFDVSEQSLANFTLSLDQVRNLGTNSVYHWYLASTRHLAGAPSASLKLNLFYPATEKHVRKYSEQRMHLVMETPEIYREHIRPYMERMREPSRLQWMRNIIDQKAEVNDVIHRSQHSDSRNFVLLPDLNWDRTTMESLHLLVIVDCNDIWSLRDLKKRDIPWLWDLRAEVTTATIKAYPSLRSDQLKFYVHYLPTYFHFHIHVVHVLLDSGSTQAVGKAVALESIISQLQTMAGDGNVGMDSALMTYAVGEEDMVWSEVLEPLTKTTSSIKTNNHDSKTG